jgi:regulator of sirC expression with transglutaminase-like and TPR domain
MKSFSSHFDPQAHLDEISGLPDQGINPAITALALASLELPGLSTQRYITHLEKLELDARQRYQDLIKEGSADDVGVRLAALKHVISDQYGYVANKTPHEGLEGANLIRVIERREGLPVALAILYVHLGTVLNWDVCVLAFPQNTLCRVEHEGQRLIYDPAQGCRVLQAPDMRTLVKEQSGTHAELSAAYFEPITSRELVIALENHIKLRLIEGGDYKRALAVVERMQVIAPQEYRLWLDAGVLYARIRQPEKAAANLERYIDAVPSGRDRDEALLLLQQVRGET